MPATESRSPRCSPLGDLSSPKHPGCCPVADCDHQLHQLVYCYYGFRPFLDNAQVELNGPSAQIRASSPAEEGRTRGAQSGRRRGRGQSASGGGRGARGRGSNSSSTGQRQTESRSATPDGRGRSQSAQKSGKSTGRATPSDSSRAASPAAGLLPTPPSQPRPAGWNTAPRARQPRPIPVSASAPVLHHPTPPQPPHPPVVMLGHLAALMDRLNVLGLSPGALPAFVRVPPPSADGMFCGSRSHGSLEVELGRCRDRERETRRRSRSGGQELVAGTPWDMPPPLQRPPQPPQSLQSLRPQSPQSRSPRPQSPSVCCPGVRGHRDSYDPRLDEQRPQVCEERSREQARAEQLLKNFDMFRDWNYVPVICASPGSDWASRRRRSCSVGSCSDSDAEPTVTICRRVGGVFHYIPAQRLLKSATATAGGPV